MFLFPPIACPLSLSNEVLEENITSSVRKKDLRKGIFKKCNNKESIYIFPDTVIITFTYINQSRKYCYSVFLITFGL